MAGASASKTAVFGSAGRPPGAIGRVIQIKAPTPRDLNDPTRPPGQKAGLTAPEETQP